MYICDDVNDYLNGEDERESPESNFTIGLFIQNEYETRFEHRLSII